MRINETGGRFRKFRRQFDVHTSLSLHEMGRKTLFSSLSFRVYVHHTPHPPIDIWMELAYSSKLHENIPIKSTKPYVLRDYRINSSYLQENTYHTALPGKINDTKLLNPYPTAFPYGNGMVLHFYQQQESSTTKTVHKVINKGLKTYV